MKTSTKYLIWGAVIAVIGAGTFFGVGYAVKTKTNTVYDEYGKEVHLIKCTYPGVRFCFNAAGKACKKEGYIIRYAHPESLQKKLIDYNDRYPLPPKDLYTKADKWTQEILSKPGRAFIGLEVSCGLEQNYETALKHKERLINE